MCKGQTDRQTDKGKGEQPILLIPCHLDIYNSIKYNHNISKFIKVMDNTRFPFLSLFRGDTCNSNMKQGRNTCM